MSHFNYESVHKSKCMFLVGDFHKVRFLNVCDDIPIGYNPHKDQVLITWMILAQKHESFIFVYCEYGVYMLYVNSICVTYLCASRDLIKN
jgi:hypothetical protein